MITFLLLENKAPEKSTIAGFDFQIQKLVAAIKKGG
jgi:hypothetical protein